MTDSAATEVQLPRGPALLYVESDGSTCHHIDAGQGSLDLTPKERHLLAALLDYAKERNGA